mmetsp:Transcript_34649/g.67908  ORF Transcript_34649/g.67908 Transcript_34649/m.67908 type:complete len:337 (+) Transcript_34649:61-1071(+)
MQAGILFGKVLLCRCRSLDPSVCDVMAAFTEDNGEDGEGGGGQRQAEPSLPPPLTRRGSYVELRHGRMLKHSLTASARVVRSDARYERPELSVEEVVRAKAKWRKSMMDRDAGASGEVFGWRNSSREFFAKLYRAKGAGGGVAGGLTRSVSDPDLKNYSEAKARNDGMKGMRKGHSVEGTPLGGNSGMSSPMGGLASRRGNKGGKTLLSGILDSLKRSSSVPKKRADRSGSGISSASSSSREYGDNDGGESSPQDSSLSGRRRRPNGQTPPASPLWRRAPSGSSSGEASPMSGVGGQRKGPGKIMRAMSNVLRRAGSSPESQPQGSSSPPSASDGD